jgi:hypothetical protein
VKAETGDVPAIVELGVQIMNLKNGGLGVWVVVMVAVGGSAWPALAADFVGQEKVEHALRTALEQRREVTYLVYLHEQAALAGAEAIADRDARGRFV